MYKRQEPGAKVNVKVIVNKLFTYKDLLTICSVLEATPLIKKKKKEVGLRDNKNDWWLKLSNSHVHVHGRDYGHSCGLYHGHGCCHSNNNIHGHGKVKFVVSVMVIIMFLFAIKITLI